MIRKDSTVEGYRRSYVRGWNSGQNYSEGALDRADRRGETHGWYDGYMDAAAGRDKWHRPNCPEHGMDEDCVDTKGAKPPRVLPR